MILTTAQLLTLRVVSGLGRASTADVMPHHARGARGLRADGDAGEMLSLLRSARAA